MKKPNCVTSIYDNEGDTLDRYTVFTDQREGDYWEALAIGNDPRGFSQFTTGQKGAHLGKLITFDDLPELIQQHIINRLE